MSPRLCAWAPPGDEQVLRVGAVLSHPAQQMDFDIYMSLIGDRVQAMVDACDYPDDAADELNRVLTDAGLWGGQHVPAEAVGNRLVWSNPSVHSKIRALFHQVDFRAASPVEMAEARVQIETDRQDAFARLIDWGCMVAAVVG